MWNEYQGRICSENCTQCHTETEVTSCCLVQSQHTGTGPTSPNAESVTPGSHQSTKIWYYDDSYDDNDYTHNARIHGRRCHEHNENDADNDNNDDDIVI